MKRKERHHTIPLSIWGEDIKPNIIELPPEQHQQIHRTQKIDHKHVRHIRKLENATYKNEEWIIERKLSAWLKFFEKIQNLPGFLILAQVQSLLKQIAYYRKIIIQQQKKIERLEQENQTLWKLITKIENKYLHHNSRTIWSHQQKKKE